ncbi:MAG: SpoIIE family protein phosphatase, partial [Deltaproteobacteria bacterium]|nr:SpoIIE family protein phosphatase [Deltaproteobacteria bacterium]
MGGFYRLKEAPWTLVIIAPGSEILSRIVRFSLYYLGITLISILIILLLIRFVTGRTVTSIKDVSDAAKKVAGGDFNVSLPVTSRDEVAELISSFNMMVRQLEERAHLKYSLNLAREVQQTLLPKKSIAIPRLDIAGESIYCDETGGDYYDYIGFPELGEGRLAVAVGDVADHGIAAALFMTTARALIRSRAVQSDDLGKMITEVNRLLCIDTEQTGNFMTLFYMLFDADRKQIHWVRAGHDPAILYDSAKDEFTELSGKGIALGVDDRWIYQQYSRNGWHYGQMVLIGTDGIWETVNRQGEKFGKDRLREIIRQNSHACSEKILKTIIDAVNDFR